MAVDFISKVEHEFLSVLSALTPMIRAHTGPGLNTQDIAVSASATVNKVVTHETGLNKPVHNIHDQLGAF